jgi:hypothetical protein
MASKNIGELRELGAKGFTPVPAGPYQTEVTNCTFKVSSNGNPMFSIEHTISAGPCKGKKVKDNVTLAPSEGSAGMFFIKMKNLGLDDAWWDALAQAGVVEIDLAAPYVAQALIGRAEVIQATVEEYQGRLNNKVGRVLNAQEAQVALSAAPVAAAGVPVVAGVPGVPSAAPSVTNAPAAPVTAAPVAPPVITAPGVPVLPPGL